MKEILRLNSDRVDAYLKRIGWAGSVRVDSETLSSLHQRHLLSVPFENLDIFRDGHPIVLDLDRFYSKIVQNGRGGFCYELNGLFASLLISLGFDIDLLSARVRNKNGEFSPEFDHLCLRVKLDIEDRLADVGFGELYREPLTLAPGRVQEQFVGSYRLCVEGKVWRYEILTEDGEWEAKYLFSLKPHQLSEFEEMCEFHQNSPESPFTRGRLCTRATVTGRITLRDDRLIITDGTSRTETPVEDDDEFHRILEEHFGIKDL